MNATCGVIGLGLVGAAVKEGLEWIGNKVLFYDIKFSGSKIEDVLETDCVFICVPTNPKKDGSCDISIVEETVERLSNLNYYGVIAIKSTVIPGTTDKLKNKFRELNIVFVPEFLRERSALVDFLDNHDVCIIGAYRNRDFEIVKKIHGSIPKNFVMLTPIEAELAKYFNNVYNTCRIVFANGFYEVCNKLGANYQKIYDAVILRDNITGHYLRCSESLRGASGPCLSKDPIAFDLFVKSLNLDINPEIFKIIVDDNAKYPKNIIGKTRTEKEYFGEEL